jgi:hypothetical protein
MLEKFKHAIKKELLIYLFTLLILTLIMHSDLLTDPSVRINLMLEKENYSHPFLYSFIVYAVVFVLRKMIDFISGIFTKN